MLKFEKIILSSILLGVLLIVGCSAKDSAQLTNIKNGSFEKETTGWSNLTVSDDGYYSPVDGIYVAYLEGNGVFAKQITSFTIEAGKTYTLKLYARSVNEAQQSATTLCDLGFFTANGEEILTNEKNVNIPSLLDAPATTPNDDGANIWFDGNYRMQLNDAVFYQPLSSDPILDSWTIYDDSDNGYDPNMATGPIITPSFKAVYSCDYTEDPFLSQIFMLPATGNPLNYSWGPETLVIEHTGDEEPWVIDPHCYYDNDTGKLWMSWGGHKFWVSELDPVTGKLIGRPRNLEFDAHPEGTHTQIADFNQGDQWSAGYQEGPALYKHNGYWYCFGTYGNLAYNYTIRVGRATNPKGPYYDKNGINMLDNGATLLFGDEGKQLVPGHPHVWEESGQTYIGYDYRTIYQDETIDYMGIRKIEWVDDWPTIYQSLTLTFDADEYSDFIGETLVIGFANGGDKESRLAVDKVELTVE